MLGVDLVKPVEQFLLAYDDPTGVTAAFNRNLLARANRELRADFDLSSFAHEARWNPANQRIEMHLRSMRRRCVHIVELECNVSFESGETIWTKSSHKFNTRELVDFVGQCGFEPLSQWVDPLWPFAENLWLAI